MIGEHVLLEYVCFKHLKLCLCPTLVRDEFSCAFINHSTTYAIA